MLNVDMLTWLVAVAVVAELSFRPMHHLVFTPLEQLVGRLVRRRD
jgi:hypothetical protein